MKSNDNFTIQVLNCSPVWMNKTFKTNLSSTLVRIGTLEALTNDILRLRLFCKGHAQALWKVLPSWRTRFGNISPDETQYMADAQQLQVWLKEKLARFSLHSNPLWFHRHIPGLSGALPKPKVYFQWTNRSALCFPVYCVLENACGDLFQTFEENQSLVKTRSRQKTKIVFISFIPIQ